MSHKIPIPPKEELESFYSGLGQSISEIARYYTTSQPTVRKWLTHYGIDRKNQKQASQETNAKRAGNLRRPEFHGKLQDEQWLRAQLSNRRVGIETVARIIGCSPPLVNRYVKKYGIIPANKKIDYEAASQLYISGKKVCEVADELNVSQATISRWLNEDKSFEARPANSYERIFHKRSAAEIEIEEYILSLGFSTLNNTRPGGMELDIIVPEANLAIEYNGLFYHTETFKPDPMFHLNKSIKAEEKGLDLFHIFEDQWVKQKSIIKSMIAHKLHKTSHIVYARKTEIREVSAPERKMFLINNHLKGADSSTHALGLYYENHLVALMSFRKPRFNDKFDWELVRYAVKIDYAVVGGFSKLLHRFRLNNRGSIISYSDRTHSVGNIYQQNGFTLKSINKPSYWYVDKNKTARYPRTSFTRHRLKNLLNITEDLTEKEMAKMLGLERIWDCGTVQWTLDEKKAT